MVVHFHSLISEHKEVEMTLNYQEKVPPVGVDHIDYAIKRTNLAVRRTMLIDAPDPDVEGPTTMEVGDEPQLRIVNARSVGPTLYLTVKRPVNPYLPEEEVDEDDAEQWVEVRREHHRFSVQEVFNDLLAEGLFVDGHTVESYIAALGRAGITVTEETVSFELVGNTLTVVSTEKNSLMWWGQGQVKLTVSETEEI